MGAKITTGVRKNGLLNLTVAEYERGTLNWIYIYNTWNSIVKYDKV